MRAQPACYHLRVVGRSPSSQSRCYKMFGKSSHTHATATIVLPLPPCERWPATPHAKLFNTQVCNPDATCTSRNPRWHLFASTCLCPPLSPLRVLTFFFLFLVSLGGRAGDGPSMVYITICLIWDRNLLPVEECFCWSWGAQCNANVGRLGRHSGACWYVSLRSGSHLNSLGVRTV